MHIPGRCMGIVDYLSKEPNGSKLDEKFMATSIEEFHRALDCLNSRLKNKTQLNRNGEILELSEMRNTLDGTKDTSFHSCYCNQSVQNRTRLDRYKNGQNSRFSNCEQNSSSMVSRYKHSVDIKTNNFKNTEEQMEDKPAKEKNTKTQRKKSNEKPAKGDEIAC